MEFLEFVERSQVQSGKNSRLSRYSKAFLFRLKLAGNWSFSNLSCVFGITKATVRNIFWEVARKVYLHALAIPNLLNPDIDMDGLFQSIFDSMDPFYQKLFKHFKDPRGYFLFCQSLKQTEKRSHCRVCHLKVPPRCWGQKILLLFMT